MKTRKLWTAIAGLSLGLIVVSLFCSMTLPSPGNYKELEELFSWGIILGIIALMVGIVGRGFSKKE